MSWSSPRVGSSGDRSQPASRHDAKRRRRRLEVDRRRWRPRVDEPQQRTGVAELAPADDVGVAVGNQVQAGAGADLEQSDRAAVAIGQPQEAGEQDCGTAGLVGLDRAMEPRADQIELLLHRGLGDGPDAVDRLRAAGAGIERGEPGSVPGQDQVMERAHQAQLGHRAGRAGDSGEQARHDAAGVDVVGGRAHQAVVEGRALGPHERVGMSPKARRQAVRPGLGVAATAVGKLWCLTHRG